MLNHIKDKAKSIYNVGIISENMLKRSPSACIMQSNSTIKMKTEHN